jgi:hypothetical protein
MKRRVCKLKKAEECITLQNLSRMLRAYKIAGRPLSQGHQRQIRKPLLVCGSALRTPEGRDNGAPLLHPIQFT